MSDRNAILNAILALFKNTGTFTTASRKFKMWSDVTPQERPALYLLNMAEDRVQDGEHIQALITMEVSVFIYTFSDKSDPEVIPSVQMSTLLDAVDKALTPSPLMGNKLTLGGLVSHCWIEGKTLIVPGDLEGDGLAVIPLKILIPF